jgi:hypothetical protein
MPPDTLATFPCVTLRVACRNCRRRGSYRLARLAARYGADLTLDALLIKLTADCHLASNRTGRPGCLAAYFPDFEIPQCPSDERRQPLRVIAGGKPTQEKE